MDKNPFAVDLGKLSLWLATLAKNHSFAFLDHAIRHGDSLVGLTREQIASFHWKPDKQISTIRMFIDKALARAESLRREIQNLSESDDDESKRQKLCEADEALADVRLIGDCVIAAYFAGGSDGERRRLRTAWEGKIAAWLSSQANRQEISDFVEELRGSERAVPCFHWEVEFPEVFREERHGFDAFIGNPPFLGGKNISGALTGSYLVYLIERFPEGGGQSDLVAYFFRRCFSYLARAGCLGMLATKTIREGYTRRAALRPILARRGIIFQATRRVPWPGRAAVTVSTVHIRNGGMVGTCLLDGRPVQRITSFLFHSGDDEDPVRLTANADISYCGSYIYGDGFTFDDQRSEATPLAVMRSLVAKEPRNGERVFPYLGGEEILTDPQHRHRRYVVDFGTMSEAEARQWPDLFQIVEEKVKPARLAQNRSSPSAVLVAIWGSFTRSVQSNCWIE